jgi:hypothetical protein
LRRAFTQQQEARRNVIADALIAERGGPGRAAQKVDQTPLGK